MKRFLMALATVVACSVSLAADPIPPDIVAVHEVAGRTRQELCSDARDWMATAFKDSKEVVQVFDAERGKLIGKGGMTLLGWASTPFFVKFTLTVECKDGKVRTTWSDFNMTAQGFTFPLKEESLNHLPDKATDASKAFDANLAKHLASAAGKSDF